MAGDNPTWQAPAWFGAPGFKLMHLEREPGTTRCGLPQPFKLPFQGYVPARQRCRSCLRSLRRLERLGPVR